LRKKSGDGICESCLFQSSDSGRWNCGFGIQGFQGIFDINGDLCGRVAGRPDQSDKNPYQRRYLYVCCCGWFNRPIPIPAIEPETEEEVKRFDAALRRKELSLILSGRMKPADSVELKKLFAGEIEI
jgi:hypothetical protein